MELDRVIEEFLQEDLDEDPVELDGWEESYEDALEHEQNAKTQLSLGEALVVGQGIVADIEALDSLDRIEGMEKFSRRVHAELRFISATLQEKGPEHPVPCSNIGYLRAVMDAAMHLPDVIAVMKKANYVSNYLWEENEDLPILNKSDSSIEIDCIAAKGALWVKVRAMNPEHVEAIVYGKGRRTDKSVLKLAKELRICASQNLFQYSIPTVLINFSNGVTDFVASKLKEMGTQVHGGHVSCLPSFHFPSLGDTVNIDVSTMLAYCSEVTNNPEHIVDPSFFVPSIRPQIDAEQKVRALPILKEILFAKKKIVSRSAKERFESIVSIIGGPTEKSRAAKFLSECEVVEDNPSPRTKVLIDSLPAEETSDSKLWNFVIFGTADRLRIPTVTSNASFLRSCADKGVRYEAILHPARGLTERKGLKLDQQS